MKSCLYFIVQEKGGEGKKKKREMKAGKKKGLMSATCH